MEGICTPQHNKKPEVVSRDIKLMSTSSRDELSMIEEGIQNSENQRSFVFVLETCLFVKLETKGMCDVSKPDTSLYNQQNGFIFVARQWSMMN